MARGEDASDGATIEHEIVVQAFATDPWVQLSWAAHQESRASRVLQRWKIVRVRVDVEPQIYGPMSHAAGAMRTPQLIAVANAGDAHLSVHPLHVKRDGVRLRVRDS